MMTKECSSCNILKDVSKFYKQKDGLYGVRGDCISCGNRNARQRWHRKKKEDPNFLINERKRLYLYEDTSEKRRVKHLRKTFKMTLRDYEVLKESQKGVCAICKEPETFIDRKSEKVRELCIDHNHSTGQIRELLCTRCNKGIGQFRDSIETLQNCVDYLKKHKTS